MTVLARRSRYAVIEEIRELEAWIKRTGGYPAEQLQRRDDLYAELSRDHGIGRGFKICPSCECLIEDDGCGCNPHDA